MSAVSARQDEPTLHDDLRAVEAAWPGWHCWLSDEGRCWAATAHYSYREGSGITVDAGHVSQLGHAIAEAVHRWQLVAA
jgi:hypothetical protein